LKEHHILDKRIDFYRDNVYLNALKQAFKELQDIKDYVQNKTVFA